MEILWQKHKHDMSVRNAGASPHLIWENAPNAVRSTASNVEEVLVEVAAARITERGATRADDNFSDSAMEDRKREGYF